MSTEVDSEWNAVPGAAAAAHLGFPISVPQEPPGPFGLADPERLTRVYEGGGFGNVESALLHLH